MDEVDKQRPTEMSMKGRKNLLTRKSLERSTPTRAGRGRIGLCRAGRKEMTAINKPYDAMVKCERRMVPMVQGQIMKKEKKTIAQIV